MRRGHDVGNFRHEMHAAENNVFGIRLRGQARELQRIAGQVGVLINVGALVMVAKNDGFLPSLARATRMRSWQASSLSLLNGSKEIVAVCMLFSKFGFLRLTAAFRNYPSAQRLSLIPGQAGSTPAADVVAVAIGILVTLKAFQDVKATVVTRLRGQCRRPNRTDAAAANEHDEDSGSTCRLS